MSILYKEIKIPLMVKKVDLDNQTRKACIERIYEIGDEMNKSSNVKADMSQYNIQKREKIFRSPLKQVMDLIEHEYPTDHIINYDYYKKGDHFFMLHTCWSAIYREDDYTIRHHHLPADISFCLYLQADKKSSPLHFDDFNYNVQPESNLLVVFPGHINHSVKKQKYSVKDRIVLAGNILLPLANG